MMRIESSYQYGAIDTPKFIILDNALERRGYNLLSMLGLNKDCLILFLLYQINLLSVGRQQKQLNSLLTAFQGQWEESCSCWAILDILSSKIMYL